MIIQTNNNNLNNIFKYIVKKSVEGYDNPDGLSATDIIKPPEVVVLLRRALSNQFDIEVDLLDSSHVVRGNAMDNFVKDAIRKYGKERYSKKGRPKESDYDIHIGKRESIILEGLGVKLSGEIDYVIDDYIHDFKNISEWTYNHLLFKYEQQLNIYAYIRIMRGLPVRGLKLDILLTNYKEGMISPPAPMLTIELPLWDFNETEKFIYNKVKNILEFEKLSTKELIEIAKENQYDEKVEAFTVIRKGKTRGRTFEVKNDNEEEALALAQADLESKSSDYVLSPRIKIKKNYDYNIIKNLI